MEEDLMYILYDETKGNCFVDLGAMQFFQVPFPVKQPSAFRFMLDEEYLGCELAKMKEYFNRDGMPKCIFFDLSRIDHCSARVFKLIVDCFNDIHLFFCNIQTNCNELIRTYYSDVHGVGSKQYDTAMEALSGYGDGVQLQITYFSQQSELKEQDDEYGGILANLREKRWCELLEECNIPETEEVFRRDSRKANKYFDLSLLDFNVYKFKSMVYYLILKLIDWIREHPNIKCGLIEQNNFTGKKKEVFLISSSVTGAIIANAIGCYINTPTVFVISLGPEEQDEERNRRLRKGINLSALKNDMIYVFDIIRFGQEYSDLKTVLAASAEGKVIAALGMANYYNNIKYNGAPEKVEIISLVNIKNNQEILDYKVVGGIN